MKYLSRTFIIALLLHSHKQAAEARVARNVAFLAAERREKTDLYFPAVKPTGKLLSPVFVIHVGGRNVAQERLRSAGFEVQTQVPIS
jgi:hypothetical protein